MKKDGMKHLWLVVLGLTAIYLVIWAAEGTDKPRVTTPGVIEPTAALIGDSKGLADIAMGDALSRIPPGSQLKIASITPQRFKGDDLKQVSALSGDSKNGFVIVLNAEIDGKTVDKLTYHAVPANTVVFVKQETAK